MKSNTCLDFLIKPPLWFVFLIWGLTLVFVASSLFCVIAGIQSVWGYVSYVAAAVTLAYTVYTAIRFVPAIKNAIKAKLQQREFTKNLSQNYGYRTTIFAVVSFCLNVAYALVHAFFAVWYRSVWYTTLAAYYFLLSLLRGGVLLAEMQAKKKANGDKTAYVSLQIRNYAACGAFLFVLEITLAGAVTLMVLAQKPIQNDPILAIATAAYTFYKLTFAIRGVLKAKKENNLCVSAIRMLSLTDAAVSLFSLQVALVAVFSDAADEMMPLNAVVGMAVCLFTVGLAVRMITTARKLKKERKEIIYARE